MINILIPLGGKSSFFDNDSYPFPKPLIEINGLPMIELVLKNFINLKCDKKFIFVINKTDCNKYHLDNVLKLLTNNACEIIILPGETKGAACSALMAIDYIDNQNPLIISNGDQVLDINFNDLLNSFENRNVDAGVICFESVHPKWSYVRLENDKIIETAEKRPVSKNAIAGFYYFKQGNLFVKAAMQSIEKDASVEGLYYIAPIFNELVLENKNLEIIKIDANKYHSFYSPQKIKEYEKIFELNKEP